MKRGMGKTRDEILQKMRRRDSNVKMFALRSPNEDTLERTPKTPAVWNFGTIEMQALYGYFLYILDEVTTTLVGSQKPMYFVGGMQRILYIGQFAAPRTSPKR